MKRQVLIHADLSRQEPTGRADPEIVREPAGRLSEPHTGTPGTPPEPAGAAEGAEGAG